MGDHRERACQECGSLIHHEDNCPSKDRVPRDAREPETKLPHAGDGSSMLPRTFDELVQCCKNVGVDLSCGACAALFFTGSEHPGATCGAQAYAHTCTAGKVAEWWAKPVATPPNAVEHTHAERLVRKNSGLFGHAVLADTVAQIEKLCDANEEIIRRRIAEGRPLPKLYESGLSFAPSSPVTYETLLTAESSLERRFADIEELVAWRVAELRVEGERAYVGAFQRVVPEGRRDGYTFVCVVRGDGKLEQPERAEHWAKTSKDFVTERYAEACKLAQDYLQKHKIGRAGDDVFAILVEDAEQLRRRVDWNTPQRIEFCGSRVDVACDRRCDKAWGLNNRPRRRLSDNPDDYVFLSDDEVGVAPFPSTSSEGSDRKPSATSHQGKLNKWCVRECERSAMVDTGQPLFLPDLKRPRPNIKKRPREGGEPPGRSGA